MFEKCSNTKFLKNPSLRNRVVPCGQTEGPKDRHNQANSRFRSFENVPKNDTKIILRSVVSSIRLQICMKICSVKCYWRTCIHKRIQMRGTYCFLQSDSKIRIGLYKQKFCPRITFVMPFAINVIVRLAWKHL